MMSRGSPQSAVAQPCALHGTSHGIFLQKALLGPAFLRMANMAGSGGSLDSSPRHSVYWSLLFTLGPDHAVLRASEHSG